MATATAGQVNTKTVSGRRQLRFQSLDDISADLDQLAAGEVQALGNWTPGQIFRHLATVMNMSIDGAKFTAPWYIRWVARLFKNRFVTSPMPSGFQLPENAAKVLVPPATTFDEGMAEIRKALKRIKETPSRAPSPVLGQLTREQYDQLQMRHCEMHLSFLVPK